MTDPPPRPACLQNATGPDDLSAGYAAATRGYPDEGNATLTSQARIQTDRASRYLVRLCTHLEQIRGKAGHRGPRAHFGSVPGGPPEVRLEWSETRAVVSLGTGRCTMQADPGSLTLLAEATDETSLRQIQDLFAGRLEKFGRREHLRVAWQRPEADTAPAHDGQGHRHD